MGEWTKAPPAHPGWYWWKPRKNGPRQIVSLGFYTEGGWVCRTFGDNGPPAAMRGWWYSERVKEPQ